MDKQFYKMPCLTEGIYVSPKKIYESFFDKKVDKRYLETAVQKMIAFNRDVFDFLGVETKFFGSGNNLSLGFVSSKYIGAVPVRMPYDGLAHKDFQVVPKFGSCVGTDDDVFSKMVDILNELDFCIEPEYKNNSFLTSPYQLRPPLFNVAVEYVRLFEEVLKSRWKKFDVIEQTLRYPVSGTIWSKYSKYSADPSKSLVFPSRRNVLSMDNIEWQGLVYVLMLAKDILDSPSVPASVKYRFRSYCSSVCDRVKDIKPKKTDYMSVRAGDPERVKKLKKQANRILLKENDKCMAWRMDMAMLFERYTQYILEKCVGQLAGKTFSNLRMKGRGAHFGWGLRYLEPDMVARINDKIVFADAKYKSHLYTIKSEISVLKDTYRHDLHQILAYCSFEPQRNKLGFLFYPSDSFSAYSVAYELSLSNVENKIMLCGIPFDSKQMDETVQKLKDTLIASI